MLRRVHLRIHLLVGLCDAAVLIDDVGDAPGVLVAGARGGTVGETDLVVGIAEQGVGEVELFREAGVLVGRVEADAEDLRVLRGVLIVEVPEPGTFDRSARCVGFRIKPEYDFLAMQIAETDLPSRMVAGLEIRRDVANFQHRCTSEQKSLDVAELAGERHFRSILLQPAGEHAVVRCHRD